MNCVGFSLFSKKSSKLFMLKFICSRSYKRSACDSKKIQFFPSRIKINYFIQFSLIGVVAQNKDFSFSRVIEDVLNSRKCNIVSMLN